MQYGRLDEPLFDGDKATGWHLLSSITLRNMRLGGSSITPFYCVSDPRLRGRRYDTLSLQEAGGLGRSIRSLGERYFLFGNSVAFYKEFKDDMDEHRWTEYERSVV